MSDEGQVHNPDLVLIIGDHHIPAQRTDLPECFKEMLNTDKIRTVLCTGNVGSQKAEEAMHQIGQDVHMVRGELDPGLGQGPTASNPEGQNLPDSLVIEMGNFKVGLINGYQIVGNHGFAGAMGKNGQGEFGSGTPADQKALMKWQRKLACDILISGHTCKPDWFEVQGKLFLNPGSVTGASQQYAGDCGTHVEPPSFMLLAIQENTVVVFIYREINGETNVEQYTYTKSDFY